MSPKANRPPASTDASRRSTRSGRTVVDEAQADLSGPPFEAAAVTGLSAPEFGRELKAPSSNCLTFVVLLRRD